MERRVVELRRQLVTKGRKNIDHVYVIKDLLTKIN